MKRETKRPGRLLFISLLGYRACATVSGGLGARRGQAGHWPLWGSPSLFQVLGSGQCSRDPIHRLGRSEQKWVRYSCLMGDSKSPSSHPLVLVSVDCFSLSEGGEETFLEIGFEEGTCELQMMVDSAVFVVWWAQQKRCHSLRFRMSSDLSQLLF